MTVTSRTATHVFLVHSTGMLSIKATKLPPEVRSQLGYAEPEKPAVPTNAPAAAPWTKQALNKVETPQLKQLEEQVGQHFKTHRPKDLLAKLHAQAPLLLGAIVAGLLLGYCFFCYCAILVCQKAGHPPGFLILVPIFQHIPLFRAAGMSPWWFLALFVPVLNLVTEVIWCFKIAQARGKSLGIGILLLLPLLNIFAFLYLAFSKAEVSEKEDRRVEVMTLDVS